MRPTPTTSPAGAARCTDAEADAQAELRAAWPGEDPDDEARRVWLATAAWPEVAFATA